MKKILCILGVIFMILTMISTDALAIKGKKVWKLYDDFSSGYIDTVNKWDLSQPPGTVFSVENGMAKIVYPIYAAAPSAWLRIKNPKSVWGIKAKVYIGSSSGNFRVRIGSIVGMIGDDTVFSQLGFEPTIPSPSAPPRVFGVLSLFNSQNPWLYDLFYGQFTRPGNPFGDPLQLVGQSFDITMIFTPNKVIYEVSGFGEIEHKLPEDLDTPISPLVALGARGNSGGVVYFDDVYILVEEK